MLSINTNLQSLIVQNNLTKSSNTLNQVIERMTTGFKLNHASDNAAGYSISKNMSSQLSSYDVAATNISMGIDMMNTAQDTISLMQQKGERLMALWTQAQNGTYGTQSLEAINQEAQALVSEINRLYDNAEYNGISLFNRVELPDWAEEVKANAGLSSDITPKYNGFIADPTARDGEGNAIDVGSLTSVSGLSDFTSASMFKISSKEDLEHLAELVNDGVDSTGKTFVLASDIDLGGEEWQAIGVDNTHEFKGIFDGNGHKISNLKINKESVNFQGLFGRIATTSTVKNTAVENVNIKGGTATGALVGINNGTVENCHSSGTISGNQRVGGVVGGNNQATSVVTNSYSSCDIYGTQHVGGLIGLNWNNGTITNSFATGDVNCSGSEVGGLLGSGNQNTRVENCYATGSVNSNGGNVGGLVGVLYKNSSVNHCYAAGDVLSNRYNTGGLIGQILNGSVHNSYATGNVESTNLNDGGIGGLIGIIAGSNLENTYALGDVKGGHLVGGLVGGTYAKPPTYGASTITNSFATGISSGDWAVGSFCGGIYTDGTEFTNDLLTITNCASSSQGINTVDGWYKEENPSSLQEYDLSYLTNNISSLENPLTTLQVGTKGDSSSQITCNTRLNLNLNISNISSSSAYKTIDKFMNALSERATEIGAVSNRLESALESTNVKMENLTSSLSTIRDADIAKESSQYIKAQILQQASATLLATANQTPSLTLQLLNGLR